MKTFFFLSVIFSLTVVTSVLYAGWTAPVSISSNSLPPVHMGTTYQTKTGGLSIQSLLITRSMYVRGGNSSSTPSGAVNLEVAGKIGANRFCDRSGTTCFTASEMLSLITAP